MSDEASREIWFEREGTRLFAVERGAGRPVVFVHGGLADHRAALVRTAALAETHRLITPDLRGAGRSIYAGELSWELLADDLAALLDHLQLERAVVGGTSMGSGVALRFALRHPHRVAAVILMAPLYPGEDLPLAPAAAAAMRAMAETGALALERGMPAFLPLFDPLPPPIRERAISMMLAFDPASVAATTRFLSSSAQPMRSASELAQLTAPTLLIPGTDPQHPADVAALYARHLPHAVLLDPSGAELVEKIVLFCK